MALAAGLVFVGVFVLIALPLAAIAASPSRATRHAMQSLDSAIRSERIETAAEHLDLRKAEQVSSIPWLNRRLLSMELVPYLSKMLAQAAMSWTPGRFLTLSAFCFAVPSYALYLRFNSTPISLGAGVSMGLLPFGWVIFKRRKRLGRFEESLPEALDMMVSALRAGHSLIAAIGLVGRERPDPVGGEFSMCFEEQNYGLEMKEALDHLLTRVPLQDLKIVSTAIMIQKESGGNLAEVLDKTAHVVRERFRLKRQIMVHTAAGRLTGWILTFVPVFLGVGMYFMNPEMMSILWKRQIGIDLMWTAAGLIVVGGFIIQRIVGIET